MSVLNENGINDRPEQPKHSPKKWILIIASIITVLLVIIAIKSIKPTPEMPVIETPIEEPQTEYDGLHVAKSSWNNGSWCLVDKETVTAIHIVPEYDGDSIKAWSLDGIVIYLNADNEVFIAVDKGIHMLGSMSGAFADFTNAKTIDGLNLLETSRVTDMSHLFENSGFEEVDISNWDTHNVSNFSKIAYKAIDLRIFKASGLDMSNAVDLSYMFARLDAVENIYFENVDTSNVYIMSHFLEGSGNCSLTGMSTFHGKLDTSKVKDFSYFFSESNITNMQDLINEFDTSNAINMEGMFYNTMNVRKLHVDNWDVSKVVNMKYMFKDLDIMYEFSTKNWNPESLENTEEMFEFCTNLLHFEGWSNAPKLKNATKMFSRCFELQDADMSCLKDATLENAYQMFYGCDNLSVIYGTEIKVAPAEEEMFSFCPVLKGAIEFSDYNWGSEFANSTTGYLTEK